MSPGGRIALVGYDRADPIGWENPGLFVVEGRNLRRLDGSLDRPIGNKTFADTGELTDAFAPRAHWLDEETLVALVASRGGSRPFSFPLDGEPVPLLDDEEVVCSGLGVGGGRVVVNAAALGDAPDLFEVASGRLRRLTTHGSRWLRPHRIEPERISVRAREPSAHRRLVRPCPRPAAPRSARSQDPWWPAQRIRPRAVHRDSRACACGLPRPLCEPSGIRGVRRGVLAAAERALGRARRSGTARGGRLGDSARASFARPNRCARPLVRRIHGQLAARPPSESLRCSESARTL